MKKSDIKPGMLVVTRSGKKYKLGMNRNDVVCLIRPEGYVELNEYNPDLTSNSDYPDIARRYDIVRIYTPKTDKDNFSLNILDHDLVRERKEEPEVILTTADVARALGIDLKRLIIKDIR